MNSQKLYVVATPIGNLEDISARALRVLGEVDLILCEDTRVTKKLLSHYGIHTATKRMDSHKEGGTSKTVKDLFTKYKTIALSSDAGTPAISDPGDRLVSATRKAGIPVEVVPGPSAITAALSISGIPSPEFTFLGFAPHKKARVKFFERVALTKCTVVFYESPHRIMKTLESLTGLLNKDRAVVVVREMTKIHEEVVEGNARKVLKYFTDNQEKIRGEFVLVIGGLN